MKATVNLTIRIIVVAIFYAELVNTKSIIKFTNIVCESRNKSWVTIDYCRLKAVSRNKTTANVNVTVLYPANDVFVRSQMVKKENGYKPWLIDYTIDVCAYMRKANHPFAKLVFKVIKDFSSVNHKCPHVGKHFLKDFYYDTTNFSFPVPTGDYGLLLTWIYDKKPQFDTNVYFNLYQGNLKFQ